MTNKSIILIVYFFSFISCETNHDQKVSTSPSTAQDSAKSTCCKNSRIDLVFKTNDAIEYNSFKTDTFKSHNGLKSKFSKMILVNGGVFLMGAKDQKMALAREFPQHKVSVNSFYMDVHEVTNAQFSEFVNATGYKTIAERPIDWEKIKSQLPPNTPKPDQEQLQPGAMVFYPSNKVVNFSDYSQWWKWVKGANWKHPFGPQSNIVGKENFPVVHVCYFDAVEYAKWSGKRLPTEAEWEYAARGGLKNKIYPWGDDPIDQGLPKCNYWTGTFPSKNTEADGFKGLAPVMNYAPNSFGLYDMAGNVWEICSDWFDAEYYQSFAPNTISTNPKGPLTWRYSLEPMDPKKVIRGGSFLCNDSYCSSYRVSARMPGSQDSGMSHIGFRCVKDI